MFYERGVGKWILPQPSKINYIPIPQLRHIVPFGYIKDPDNEGWLLPIAKELDALRKAKKHLKTYSYKQVAAWLSKQTGRTISENGLRVRIENEQSYTRRITTYKRLANKYEAALKKAAQYEKGLGATDEGNFFHCDRYKQISATFVDRDD
jgi:hypothetical protein